MIGKSLFCLSIAAAIFLGLSAGAVTTSQNVDIIVTHGAPLTTFTFVNNTGSTLPAGSPVSFGQGFRYGDVMPGTYPLIRDAITHSPLAGQQWDEISRWLENGGNGSWRHAVWAIWLPQDLPAGAPYTVEFVPTAGTYAQTSHQPLSVLCSGPAAHDLKIHRTDVRNQDDTVRDSGDATFRLCDNIANVGRDAPRHLRAGNVYDEYEVSGVPVYTSGHKDPLLYDRCTVDIFTKASDGVSAGDVKWVCHDINAWMNVAAGSTGNPGNPGPAGFANDPQAISSRVEIDDGASNILNWSGLDATISSASNPIQSVSSEAPSNFAMNVPSSTGPNTWFEGQSVRASCSATCVAGLTNGETYYVFPAASANSGGAVTNQVALMSVPYSGVASPMTAAQGTGTTTFSTVLQLYHWQAWQTMDWTGLPNWSPFGTTSRVTRKVFPAFTMAEKRYWEETGLILPMNLSQPAGGINPGYSNALGFNYEPMSRGLVIGGQGPGPRPDIGACGEFACQAFLTETELNWDQARRFTLGTSMHGAAMFLDEATGRIPPLNNGPPTGPGGNGVGGSYAGLGALHNQVELMGGGNNTLGIGLLGMADIPHATPELGLGPFFYGTYLSHVPNFAGFTYTVFGDRFFLDLMRWRANADFAQQRVGPGPELGEAYYRDNNAVATDGNTYHYYGLLLDCCQTRGLSWMWRDILYATTFGSDTDIERSYFHDIVEETSNYYPLWEKFKDGPGNSNYSTSVIAPNNPGPYEIEAFQVNYQFDADWFLTVWLREPLGVKWAAKFQRFQEGCLGGQLAGAPVSFYCVDYVYQDAIHTAAYPGSSQGGHVGPGLNGVDLSDFGSFGASSNVGVGGQLSVSSYTLTTGDTVMELAGWIGQGYQPIDQLSTWHTIMSPVDNTQFYHSYYVQCTAADHITWPTQCPVAGQAFTGFTTNGTPFAANAFQAAQIKYRLRFDPGALAGYVDPNYDWYTGQINNGLQILGYNVSHAQADFAFRVGPNGYNPAFPSTNWDPSVVIPGLPTARNGL